MAVVLLLQNDLRQEAWMAPHVDDDDELTVYAESKRAAVITHDVRFTYRRQKKTIGQHIRLQCSPVDAVDVLRARHVELFELLRAKQLGVFIVSRTRVEYRAPRWED